MTFKREDKYLVERWEDINKLPEEAKEALLKAVSRIEANRAIEGKTPCHKYVVVNEDEPYSQVVWKLIEISQDNKEGLAILLENLEVELAGY